MLSAPPPPKTPPPDSEPDPYEYGGLLMLGCEPTPDEFRAAARLRTARQKHKARQLVEGGDGKRPDVGLNPVLMGTLDLTDIHALINRRDGGVKGKPVTFASAGVKMPGQPIHTSPENPASRPPTRFPTRSSIPIDGGPLPQRGSEPWSPKKNFASKFETSLVPESRRTHLRGAARLSTERPPALTVRPMTSESQREALRVKYGMVSRAPSGAQESGRRDGSRPCTAVSASQYTCEWWKEGILKDWLAIESRGGVGPGFKEGAGRWVPPPPRGMTSAVSDTPKATMDSTRGSLQAADNSRQAEGGAVEQKRGAPETGAPAPRPASSSRNSAAASRIATNISEVSSRRKPSSAGQTENQVMRQRPSTAATSRPPLQQYGVEKVERKGALSGEEWSRSRQPQPRGWQNPQIT